MALSRVRWLPRLARGCYLRRTGEGVTGDLSCVGPYYGAIAACCRALTVAENVRTWWNSPPSPPPLPACGRASMHPRRYNSVQVSGVTVYNVEVMIFRAFLEHAQSIASLDG